MSDLLLGMIKKANPDPINFLSGLVDQSGALAIIKRGVKDIKVFNARPNYWYSFRYITKSQPTFGDTILMDRVDSSGTRTPIFNAFNKTYDISNRNGISTITVKADNGEEIIQLTFDYSAIPDGYIPPNTGTTHPFYLNQIAKEKLSYGKDAVKRNLVEFNSTTSDLNIYSKYGNSETLKLVFGKKSINQLFAFYNVYKNASLYPSKFTTGTAINSDVTDSIGPYTIQALTNGDAGAEMFTGGTHSTLNTSTTGNPTAETIDFKIVVDGVKVAASGDYYGNKIEVFVRNRIMSYNTKTFPRYTHEEHVRYVIDSGRIDLSVTIFPYERLLLKKYYGLQAVSWYYNDTLYVMGQTQDYTASKNIDTSSGSKGTYRLVDTAILKRTGTNETLEIHIEPTIGMGTKTHIADTDDMIFSSGNKHYFRLVGGTGKELNAGEMYQWKGFYAYRNEALT